MIRQHYGHSSNTSHKPDTKHGRGVCNFVSSHTYTAKHQGLQSIQVRTEPVTSKPTGLHAPTEKSIILAKYNAWMTFKTRKLQELHPVEDFLWE